jgi:hypothetical protein
MLLLLVTPQQSPFILQKAAALQQLLNMDGCSVLC